MDQIRSIKHGVTFTFVSLQINSVFRKRLCAAYRSYDYVLIARSRESFNLSIAYIFLIVFAIVCE